LPAVADSGPLIHLAQAGQIKLLRAIFTEVSIVREVKREVIDEGIRREYPDADLVADAIAEGYIVVHKVRSRATKRAVKLSQQERISKSDSETLILAKTLRRPLLTDERVVAKLAKMYDLEVWNTWTILLEALRWKLIDKEQIHKVINELGQKRHKLTAKNAREILTAAEKIARSSQSRN
jgi:predicted nucleic acid-binding protein